MKTKACLFFVYSSALLICVAALAKIVSSFGASRVLHMPDPVFGITFGKVFLIVGFIEMCVCGIIFLATSLWTRVGLIAMLATSFGIYRLGLVWIGYHRPCPCLGSLTDAIHLPAESADTAMKVVLAYLLIGSYGVLFHLWWESGKVARGRLQAEGQNSQVGASG